MTAAKQRDPLTKDRIVATAIALADANDIESLSMRKLAAELGTGAMSLYNHVADKDALLAAMVDGITAKIDGPTQVDGAQDPAGWRATMRAAAISAHDTYLRHPWAITVALQAPPGPIRLRHMESVLGAFANSGLDPETAHHAYHAYEVHISGFTLSQVAFRYDEDQLKQLARGFLDHVDHQAFPNVVAHVHEHLDDRGSDFEFGLDLLLDGLERLRG